MKEFLRLYDELGFCVIPLRRRDKAPALMEWRTYQQRRSLPQEWRHWWPSYSVDDGNIGIVTGQVSQLVVIDCDSMGTYYRLCLADPSLRNTLTVHTGKGAHIYLRPDREPVQSATFRLDGKLHHVQAEGRQVVAPPSIHPSGRTYEIAHGGEPLVYPMEKLRDVLRRAGAHEALPEQEYRPASWAEELFDRQVQRGERNVRATQLAGLLRHYFPESRWGLAYAILRDWNEKYCDPPLSQSELESVVRSVSRYPGGQPS